MIMKLQRETNLPKQSAVNLTALMSTVFLAFLMALVVVITISIFCAIDWGSGAREQLEDMGKTLGAETPNRYINFIIQNGGVPELGKPIVMRGVGIVFLANLFDPGIAWVILLTVIFSLLKLCLDTKRVTLPKVKLSRTVLVLMVFIVFLLALYVFLLVNGLLSDDPNVYL